LGFEIERETPKEIRSSCLIHGGDNKSAFRFNKDTNTWVCFTHKCHDIHGNDLIGLVMAITGRDFMAAVDYLKQFVPNTEDIDYVSFKRTREIETFIRSCETVNIKPKSVNESSLKSFRSLGADFFIRQGFKQSTMDYFEIGYGWTDKNGLVRCVIPIRDEKGELVAYSLRDTTNNIIEEDFKYILTPGFNKQGCLYNLNNAKKFGAKLPLIIVEGFKSVWRLHEYGIKNVVATMGSSITEGQQLLMYLYALKGAVVFFDNDKAGVEGTIKACNDFSGKLDIRPVFIQEVDEEGAGLDPADLTKEQVYEYLDTYF
jgi:DNA primase